MRSLIILGMHRSGTSLVAQACAAAGIGAGPSGDMLAAQADNPAGFYEHRDLVALNETLLHDCGGAWYLPPDAPITCSIEQGEALLDRLAESEGSQFLLKDPRLCITWPSWEPLLDTPTLLYVYRDALAVAYSLKRRNHFPLQLGLLLWEDYNRRALNALAGRGGMALSYDAILDAPQALEHCLEQLQASGFHCEPARAVDAVDPALRHLAGSADDPDRALLTPQQRHLEELCVARCDGREPGEVEPMDALSRARLEDLASAVAPLAAVYETGVERDEALTLSEERTGERDRALAELSTLERDHKALNDAHEQEVARHAEAASALATLEVDHGKLAAAHDREVAAHEDLAGKHVDLTEKHEGLHRERADLEARLSRLEAEHAALEDKANYLFFSLTEAYRGLLTFETSTLAALERQGRRVYRLLTWQRGRRSSYEDVLEHAHEHFDAFDIDKPQAPRGRLQLLGEIVRYMRENPAGSARSFSWPRFKRAARLFFGSSRADLAVWVDARFPESDALAADFDPAALDPALDSLELEFPHSEAPTVSIIVPVYNDYRVTVNCLRSVQEFSGSVPYELIVADDCSTDLTVSINERMHGIHVSRSPENLRFLRNCNQAAAKARGAFLLFLNNDTQVTDGWLDALLKVFDDPHVAVAGPKLLFADGRLQEAGGIVWNDASAWNFGRADDPDKPAYRHRREVDYLSGACLMIRRSVWEQLAGFDERFAPAYYEDADICFAARDAGYRVVYQPESVVYHFEGVSNGTDLSAGVKQHQVTNQAVFQEKWREVLEAEHFANGEHVVWARDRSARKPCVLVIDHYVPHYDRDAGGRSTFQYLELLLSLGCRVQFMGANFFRHKPYTQRLEAMGVEVLAGESIARDLDSWLVEHAPYIDEIVLHRPHVAEQFLPHLEKLKACPPITFFGHDLHYLRFQREAALADSDALRREAKSWHDRELAVMARVDRIVYFSQAELDELRGQVDESKLFRVPLYAMQLDALPVYAPSAAADILFVGGYNHPPNVDAAVWLAEELLPRLLAQVKDATLHLVGSNPSERVLSLASEQVQVHGYLSDEELDALYRQVRVAVVPLRFGAGVKGKVIEAIARNVPVVTTDIGAEGIPDAERVMWVENTAEDICDRLAAIISGEIELETRMSHYASWLEEFFAAQRAADILRTVMPALAGRGDRV